MYVSGVDELTLYFSQVTIKRRNISFPGQENIGSIKQKCDYSLFPPGDMYKSDFCKLKERIIIGYIN